MSPPSAESSRRCATRKFFRHGNIVNWSPASCFDDLRASSGETAEAVSNILLLMKFLHAPPASPGFRQVYEPLRRLEICGVHVHNKSAPPLTAVPSISSPVPQERGTNMQAGPARARRPKSGGFHPRHPPTPRGFKCSGAPAQMILNHQMARKPAE